MELLDLSHIGLRFITRCSRLHLTQFSLRNWKYTSILRQLANLSIYSQSLSVNTSDETVDFQDKMRKTITSVILVLALVSATRAADEEFQTDQDGILILTKDNMEKAVEKFDFLFVLFCKYLYDFQILRLLSTALSVKSNSLSSL